VQTEEPKPCLVQAVEGGANIICPDSQAFIANGETGATGNPGLDGANGVDGYSTLVKVANSALCVAGGVEIITGLDLDRNNELDLSEQEYSSTICNGETGATGSPGAPGIAGPASTSPFDIVQIIDVCGDAPGILDEIFLKLRNGNIVASFSDNANGQNTRFSLLSNGNFRTTDGSNCFFTVNNGIITNEHY